MKRTLFFIALALASACGMSSYHAENTTGSIDGSGTSDAATGTDAEKTVQSLGPVDADTFSQASIY